MYCFQQENAFQVHPAGEPLISDIHLSFSARFSSSGSQLELLAVVHALPHRLSLEADKTLQMIFRPPFTQTKESDLDLEVSCETGDVYHVTTTSYFPGGVRYEREYRIRLHITQPSSPKCKYCYLNHQTLLCYSIFFIYFNPILLGILCSINFHLLLELI